MAETVATTMTSRLVNREVRRRIAEPLDLLAEAGVLLDEGIGLRHVRLGSVVVVVADAEVLHRILGKNCRSSAVYCAASVLLGCITSIGRCSRSASQAMVAVFPVPVAPSRMIIVLAGLELAVRARLSRRRLVAGLLKRSAPERCQPTGDLFYRTHTLKARRRYRRFRCCRPRGSADGDQPLVMARSSAAMLASARACHSARARGVA